MLIEQLRAVDAVVELVDARAPLSSANPDLRGLTRGKARLLVLNKADLADDAATSRWLEYYPREKRRGHALQFQRRARQGDAGAHRPRHPAGRGACRRPGVKKTVRLMVVGIPNVGKSTFINRLNGSAVAKASDRPGVTRAKQWVKLGPYLEMLDTPGMLPPRLDDQKRAQNLAFLGSVRDQILDTQELAGALLRRLLELKPYLARFQIGGNGAERRRRSAATCRPVACRRGAPGGCLQGARLAFVRRAL